MQPALHLPLSRLTRCVLRAEIRRQRQPLRGRGQPLLAPRRRHRQRHRRRQRQRAGASRDTQHQKPTCVFALLTRVSSARADCVRGACDCAVRAEQRCGALGCGARRRGRLRERAGGHRCVRHTQGAVSGRWARVTTALRKASHCLLLQPCLLRAIFSRPRRARTAAPSAFANRRRARQQRARSAQQGRRQWQDVY